MYTWNIKIKNDEDYLITSHIALSTHLYFSFMWYIMYSICMYIIYYIYITSVHTSGEGVTEDEMVGWHHWLSGYKFEQTSGRQWRMGKPGVLQSVRSQRVKYDLGTEQQHVLYMSLLQCFMSQILVKYKRFFLGVFVWVMYVKHFPSVIISTSTPRIVII